MANLRQRTETAAQAHWTPAEIDAARKAALQQAFAIASGAAGTAESTVDRHRWLSRKAIGF